MVPRMSKELGARLTEEELAELWRKPFDGQLDFFGGEYRESLVDKSAKARKARR